MSLLKLKAKNQREQPDEVQSQSVPARVIGYILLTIAVLATLFPIYWMLRTALSLTKTLFSDPFSILPVNFTWVVLSVCLVLPAPPMQLPRVVQGPA